MELFVTPEVVPEKIVECQGSCQEKKQEFFHDKRPVKLNEYLAPELWKKSGQEKHQSDGVNGTDIVDADMTKLYLFGKKVIFPFLPYIANNLGDRNKKSKTDGQAGYCGMEKGNRSNRPFSTQNRKFNMIHQ
jgi:hypothetical protein